MIPLLLDLLPRPADGDFLPVLEALALRLADERVVLLDLREPDFAEPDLAEPARAADVDFDELDLAALDFPEPDLAAELFAPVVLELEVRLVVPDFAEAPDFEVLFFAEPPLFDDEAFAAEDFAPDDRLDELPVLDFAPVDLEAAVFDVVDFDEPDLVLDFDFEELVGFLVVGILVSSSLQIGFERSFEVLQ